MNKINYQQIAIKQFFELKEETESETQEVLGAEVEKDYEINGFKFKIHVDGYWEKAVWFDWIAYNEQGKIIEEGAY